MNGAQPKRILITTGEPAGIGPDITIHCAQLAFSEELIVIADPDLLLQRAKKLGLPLQLITADLNQPPTPHVPGTLKIYPIKLPVKVEIGKLNPDNAQYVIQTLSVAAKLCQEKKAHAIVTGPVQKSIINQAGISFSGHTEFFAEYCHIPQTVMLFVVDQLKVALATTHLPLSQVSSAITEKNLQAKLAILSTELSRLFRIQTPRILVCGLNPHAGENGHLGREEIDIISPLIQKLRRENYIIEGPLPADTIFTPKYLLEADAILAMYHDQALPLVKYIGFGQAVNVTLGLPFIRTSVDHGTALDVAGTAAVDAGSMIEAIKLAITMLKTVDACLA